MQAWRIVCLAAHWGLKSIWSLFKQATRNFQKTMKFSCQQWWYSLTYLQTEHISAWQLPFDSSRQKRTRYSQFFDGHQAVLTVLWNLYSQDCWGHGLEHSFLSQVIRLSAMFWGLTCLYRSKSVWRTAEFFLRLSTSISCSSYFAKRFVFSVVADTNLLCRVSNETFSSFSWCWQLASSALSDPASSCATLLLLLLVF